MSEIGNIGGKRVITFPTNGICLPHFWFPSLTKCDHMGTLVKNANSEALTPSWAFEFCFTGWPNLIS